jgi:hypothetical protein
MRVRRTARRVKFSFWGIGFVPSIDDHEIFWLGKI